MANKTMHHMIHGNDTYEIVDKKGREDLSDYFRSAADNMTVIQQESCYIIKDENKHIAFPSVLSSNNDLYLAYRSATSHTSYDGVINIMTGTPTSMTSFGTIVVANRDCRDPKLVYFNNTTLCIFTTRTEGERHKVWACDISDLENPYLILDGYFTGGQPYVDEDIIYIPCYRNKVVYIAYGSELNDLTLVEVGQNGNECAITKTKDGFLLIYRDWDDYKNGHIIKTRSLDSIDSVEELPINTHCPMLYKHDNYGIIFSYRSNNSEQNVNGFYSELNLLTLTASGKFTGPKINLFAGNNTDLGYTSMCIQGYTMIFTYYYQPQKAIYILTVPHDKWYTRHTYGDIVYRTIPRQLLSYPSTGKKYIIYAPLGSYRIVGLWFSIPSDIADTLKNNYIYTRSFYDRSVVLNAVGNGSSLNTDAVMVCMQNKYNGPMDYANASNSDGTIIEVTS